MATQPPEPIICIVNSADESASRSYERVKSSDASASRNYEPRLRPHGVASLLLAAVLLMFLSPSESFKSFTSSNAGKAATPRGLLFSQGNGKDVKTSDVFSLESIRSTLVRQEETIIFALIERAQYRKNRKIYDSKDYDGSLMTADGQPVSFLEFMLMETEKLHSKVRRYTSPEEHPFYPALLPTPILPELNYPQLLVTEKILVDVNAEVMKWYVHKLTDQLCVGGDDEQHGSSVLCDISAMQAISRRVHYGKFVAESKFKKDPDIYTRLVAAGDVVGILELLTNVEVERKVLRRAFAKASTYGQDITGTTEGYKVEPRLIADIYRDMIIPLTKDVEVRYIFRRVGAMPPPADTYFQYCRGPMDAFDDPLAPGDFKVSAKRV